MRLGGIVTADYFLNCAETRANLFARFGAQAIDMESGAVNQVAEAWSVPALRHPHALRSGGRGKATLTYPQMAQMAAHNSALCVLDLLAMLSEMDASAQARP